MPKSDDKIVKIRDPIYGFIYPDAQELEIINHPVFQRLRRIKQLSLTDMVYPGATHTRFEHSLGVMQMASDMFDCLIKRESNLKTLRLNESDIFRTRKILRLAALLHDTGHAPFSHAGENTMPLLPEDHPRYEPNTEKPKRYDHEDYSIAIIKFLLKDIIEDHPSAQNSNIKVDEVTFLLGDKAAKPRNILLVLKEIISGQIDADRADYLLRDSLHLGVSYGIYDKNRLVNSITLGHTDTDDVVLAIEEGGWHIAESLVIARYQMFSQVYFHKTRRIFDYHISEALKEILLANRVGGGVFRPPTSNANLLKYLEFDDWKVHGDIKNGKGGEHGKHILERTPYRCIKTWEQALSEETTNEINDLEKCYSDKDYFVDKDVSTKWYKLDKDIWISNDQTGKSYPLSLKSQIVKSIGQPEVTRFYVSRDMKDESN